MSKFILEITLGNDAMQTGDHINHIMRRVAHSISGLHYTNIGTGTVKDANGNTVGYYEVTE